MTSPQRLIGLGIWWYMEEQIKKRRKTKWSFHLWNVGEIKTMPRHELPLFRSALSVWNKTNPKIDYDYTNTVQTVTVKRIS